MLGDASDAVAALGLECVILLCSADTLDFYAAWAVVQQQFPGLPRDRPLAARKWVALLGHGALDAAAEPERAAAVIDLLWLAVKDPAPQAFCPPQAHLLL